MNAARIGNSERLRRTLNALREAGHVGLTTWELQRITGNCNPHTDVSEIQQKVNDVDGIRYEISCDYEGMRNGRRIHRYRLVVDAAEACASVAAAP